MILRRSAGVKISPLRSLLHFNSRFAMESPFRPPSGTTPHRHFPPRNPRVGLPGPTPSRIATKINIIAVLCPQPPSPGLYLSVAAPQPVLHNAQPSPNACTPMLFPRHHSLLSVSSRFGTRPFAVLRFVHPCRPRAQRHTCDNARRKRQIPVEYSGSHARRHRVPSIVFTRGELELLFNYLIS